MVIFLNTCEVLNQLLLEIFKSLERAGGISQQERVCLALGSPLEIFGGDIRNVGEWRLLLVCLV